jgi:hypothetical protein
MVGVQNKLNDCMRQHSFGIPVMDGSVVILQPTNGEGREIIILVPPKGCTFHT